MAAPVTNFLASVVLVVLGATLTALFNAWGPMVFVPIWLGILIVVAVLYRSKVALILGLSPLGQKEKATLPLALRPGRTNICDPGPYDVESGKPTQVPFDAKSGDQIEGYLKEIDGYDFDWSIVDRTNLVAALRGDDYYEELGGQGDSIYEVEWTVPEPGPWFLLLSAAYRQIVREVLVHLERIKDI